MNSFAGTKRMERNIEPAKDEAVEVRRATVSVGEADFCCTDDIWHLKADSAVVWDKREEKQPAESLSMPTRHLRESRELHFRCVPI
jgi:hypothetical protein